jgi:8-oxo-dGTP pyrophosphatase MutT (NUDIX family)
MTRESLTETLKNAPLPGYEAQKNMEHFARFAMMQRQPIVPENHRVAAVMCLLYPANADWNVVFIVRPHYDGAHSGQIAFAGGGIEPEDPNYEATALRETHEEIGVEPHLIEIIAPLYIPISNFMVYPFVGILENRPIFTPQESEVVDILEIPLNVFRNADNIKMTNLHIGKNKDGHNIVLGNVPYYDLNGQVLWGATAMMIAELMAILENESRTTNFKH